MLYENKSNPRYDISYLSVFENKVSNWKWFKIVMKMSKNETDLLSRTLRNKFHLSMEEQDNYLLFEKPISSLIFNEVLKKFIDDNKVCPSCHLPEVIDHRCRSCGFWT